MHTESTPVTARRVFIGGDHDFTLCPLKSNLGQVWLRVVGTALEESQHL